ncbi:IS3 family transposase, partial [Extensimonas sp. H3M7-6]|uniref:IS3 family transposase n=1 Tax=Extensimonas soli TaxID=3031322 RepID=UPI0023DBA4EC
TVRRIASRGQMRCRRRCVRHGILQLRHGRGEARHELRAAHQNRDPFSSCVVQRTGRRNLRQAGFRSRRFVHRLGHHQLVGSMGRVGACGDNAAMESFFALLQKNVLNQRRWDTREQLRIAIVTWIERTYHRRRRQDRLGRLTPIEYETTMTTPADQAA